MPDAEEEARLCLSPLQKRRLGDANLTAQQRTSQWAKEVHSPEILGSLVSLRCHLFKPPVKVVKAEGEHVQETISFLLGDVSGIFEVELKEEVGDNIIRCMEEAWNACSDSNAPVAPLVHVEQGRVEDYKTPGPLNEMCTKWAPTLLSCLQ